jgi:hypothetical protein
MGVGEGMNGGGGGDEWGGEGMNRDGRAEEWGWERG